MGKVGADANVVEMPIIARSVSVQWRCESGDQSGQMVRRQLNDGSGSVLCWSFAVVHVVSGDPTHPCLQGWEVEFLWNTSCEAT